MASLQRVSVLFVLAQLVLAAAAARAQDPPAVVGVLTGPSDQAARRGERLVEELHRRDRAAVAPAELRRRLSASAAAIDAVKAARAAVRRSEQHALYMKRLPALAAAREALARLDSVAARHHAPTLTARAHVARALSFLLHPADEARALESFRAAVAADPGYRPDPDRLPSRAAGLLRKAQQEPAARRATSLAELATLTRLAGLARLVWIGATRGGGIGWLVYDARQRDTVATGRGTQTVRDLLALLTAPREKTPPRLPGWASPSPATLPASQPLGRGEDRPGPARPWYKRWWVWTLVGVGVGVGVGAAVLATRSSDPSYAISYSY
jgi:hypothetical protein